jgi:hypothetical protein
MLRRLVGQSGAEKADHRHCRLLRARRERPCYRRTAKQRDQLAPPHVEHGAPSLGAAADPTSPATAVAQSVCRIFSLPLEQSSRPWGRPESF